MSPPNPFRLPKDSLSTCPATLTAEDDSSVVSILLAFVFTVVLAVFPIQMVRTVGWRGSIWETIEGVLSYGAVIGWLFGISILLGLLCILWLIKGIHGLLNPTPTVTVSSQVMPLGGTITIKWKMSGRSERIRQLRLFFSGKAIAECGGWDTATLRFAKFPITEIVKTNEIRSGEIVAKFPENTMYSFTARSQRITWSIGIYGKIDYWPDVETEYPIVVLPLGVSQTATPGVVR